MEEGAAPGALASGAGGVCLRDQSHPRWAILHGRMDTHVWQSGENIVFSIFLGNFPQEFTGNSTLQLCTILSPIINHNGKSL